MNLLSRLPLDDLTPGRLWKELDDATREVAVRAMYSEAGGRREADDAVAAAIRFRPTAVRKLPLEKRVGYLLRRVVVDDPLASSLLMALHLQARPALLESFLDRLEIPHDGGLIDEAFELEPPPADRLRAAVTGLEQEHPAEQVELYLASLLALDADTWGGLDEVVRERS